ncbi:hypothetical protein [Spiroplasma turonicum]|uniref:Lipoprotein n=1 Tax=Spiroplasma turonicum TaxID=216946 RepID=A0A0K1P611_9MOLU|nr:hypothetical protein [Spiroplasma turonicum]AKU79614.1 hypothetical protein STURON_00368 [Spiroplasma turonicum]ALX70636.1 hypothetical protein STURO_v1c03680 [Spiroplasma turonicum]
MKKLLTILSSLTISSTLITPIVISCGTENKENKAKFNLDVNSISGSAGERIFANITNYDDLSKDNLPDTIEYTEKDYLEVTIDHSNKRIQFDLLKSTTSEIKVKILSVLKEELTVTVTIDKEKLSLNKVVKVKQFIAGNKLDDGTIDASIAVGSEGFKITNKSIIDSLNNVNQASIDINQVDIEQKNAGENGIGAAYEIKAKKESENLTGSVTVTLNKGINVNDFFVNKDLGNIFLYKGAYSQLENVLKDEKDKTSIISMAVENLGAANKDFEYLRGNLLFFAKGITTNAQLMIEGATPSNKGIVFNNIPDMKIFKPSQTLKLSYNIVEEIRMTLFEALPESKIKVSKELYETQTYEKSLELKKLVYSNLSESFKKTISEEHFISFTRIKYNVQKSNNEKQLVTKIDVLPGSNIFYGHDGGSFNSYIVTDKSLEGFTNGGDLSKYEEGKKLAEKYSQGMGFYNMFLAMQGNFCQGHDIFEVEN